ncbi:hypothetical protein L2E82_44443 [Cichorium intybus]|uniref:Uncharacterized protein n=1 Tax=Cichorium intybus TaxID=13427 RepID=A0ACB8ZQK6_CICIN|nr:hypothetical protein L2E82_44443 [Cichorium intybus]
MEAEFTKLREEEETGEIHKERSRQIGDILKVVSDLSTAVGNLANKEASKKSESKEPPTIDFGSFIHSDEEEIESIKELKRRFEEERSKVIATTKVLSFEN